MARRKGPTPPTPPTPPDNSADRIIQAQNQHLETQEAVYESIAAAQQKGIKNQQLLLDVYKKLKKEASSFAETVKKGVKEQEALNEAAKELDKTGVPIVSEMKDAITSATKSSKDFKIALFALGAAGGALAYNLGLVGDRLGTIAKYQKKLIPLQESLDLLKADIRGTFSGQRAAGEFGFQMQRMAVSFQKASATALFGKGLGSVGYGAAQLQLAGIGAEQIASQMQAAGDATGKMPSSKVASDMAVLAARTGQSAEGIASINEMFMRVDGSSQSTALNMQEGLRAMADSANINLGGLMAEMAESSKEMLGYQIKSGSALARQVTFARSMGVSFQDIAKAGQSMVLNYKDSIKSEMQLSAMLGKNVDLSQVRSSFAAGDTEGALKALKAQGLDPAKMDMFQQQMLQQATGMDLSTLSKINKNEGRTGNLGAGNAKAGNQSFLGRTEAAARTEAIQNAAISVEEGKFNIRMDAAEELAISQNKQVQSLENQIKQTEALRDAELGLTTALISIISGLATSGIGGMLKDMAKNPFGKNDFRKNSAGRMIDKKTGKFVSAETVAKGRTGTSMSTKIGGSVAAGVIGGVQGYQNFNAKRAGEEETRTTDKLGAGFVQGGLAAAGTAIGAAFGGPVGMMIGGFLGDTLGGALNEYAPGLAQGVGDIFTGMSIGWDMLKEKMNVMWQALQPVRDLFASLAKKLGFEEGGMSGILQTLGKYFFDFLIWPINIFVSAITSMGNIIGGVVKIMKGDWAGGLSQMGGAVKDFILDGLLAPFKGVVASLWNWVADSKIGKWLGMGKMEVPKVQAKKETKAATAGVDTKVSAAATNVVSTNGANAGTNANMAGSKSVTEAISNTSKWTQDKMTYMSGNLERVVDRTTKTANNTAASLEQLKVLNTNTMAMKDLTRKIEALTRATYEGGAKVMIDGKVLATAVDKYQSNTAGTNPESTTPIFRGTKTTYA